RTTGLGADAQAQFQASLQNLQQRETELRSALRTSRMSTNSSFASTREQLASAYEAYAAAVAQFEASANVTGPNSR
ncbi:MAG: hypothetical protein JWQ83_2242, partial [Lacunisphaera sp.]|nr:hypothetical protein [Lacunisphaera sp.]